jgi:hypothetical protein
MVRTQKPWDLEGLLWRRVSELLAYRNGHLGSDHRQVSDEIVARPGGSGGPFCQDFFSDVWAPKKKMRKCLAYKMVGFEA